jgi:hypothetical protein
MKELQSFVNFLQDVVGFFLIETILLKTTCQFRSHAAVEILWDQTVSNLAALIQNCLVEGATVELLLEVKKIMIPFLFAMQVILLFLYQICHRRT